MSTFITNSKQHKLQDRLLALISQSKELKFLVGFFYFSGLKILYEGLQKNKDVIVKVLVGLNVDNTVHGLLEYQQQDKERSDEERLFAFLNSVKNSLSTEYFDNQEFHEQVRFFLELIKTNRLLIRKTREPNHAKLYIFKLQENQVGRNTLFITGSSNLTSAGLTHQHEFNVEISDYGFEETEKYFDHLWEEAVIVTENEKVKRGLVHVVETETFIKEISPFEAYAFVLKTYLDTFRGKDIGQRLVEVLQENGYKAYSYQLDAVKQALSLIEQYNGAIIADVVGLGKTVIACLIAWELKKRGIVISPPGILGDEKGSEGWNKYLEDFHLKALGWNAFSLGDLDSISEFLSKAKDVEVVIVDEAHRFRNQDTKSYECLKNICRGKKVILLTATPFNNRPSDIFSLLKLFITPKRSQITLFDNLENQFSELQIVFDKLSYIRKYALSSESTKREKVCSFYQSVFGENMSSVEKALQRVREHSHFLASQIKGIIEPVTIRRNRLDLQENPHYREEIKELSKIEDPQEWFFGLTKKQSMYYDRVINHYFASPENGGMFKGAIYRPFIYQVGIANIDALESNEYFQYASQLNLYDFMRRILVKRFESSFGAFKQSLENFKQTLEIVQAFVEKTGKYILDRQLIEKIYDSDNEEIESALNDYAEKIRNDKYPKNHQIYEIDTFEDRDQFLKDIESDKRLFETILSELDALELTKNDPKIEKLIQEVKKCLQTEPDRKIIVFSEYTDTVKYIAPRLQERFHNRVLVVAGNLTKTKTNEIYANFDAAYPLHKQKNDYDILVATDKISEGFNLNRAGMVINYDIPWNPVRVIQRVGRINRISKKVFDRLFIVNFFPTEQGADLVRSREIAANKMFLIHTVLGEDSKIFDVDEEPSASGLYHRFQQNPDNLERESFYTKVIKEYEKIRQTDPELVQRLQDFPTRLKVAKPSDTNELFVIIKKGRLFVHHKSYDEAQSQIKSLEECFDAIKADKHTPSLPLSQRFWEEYENIQRTSQSFVNSYSENSVEQKAINNLRSMLYRADVSHKYFIRKLLEDILDYGTLPEYTLRRIARIGTKGKGIEEIEKLRDELGEDYLDKEREKLTTMKKDIIIAIEHHKGANNG